MGYYFYYPPENKIVDESYADFLEKDFILQKESWRIVELEDEDILPSKNTSEHPIEEESLALIVSQEEDVILVRRSVRTHKAPDRLCLNVKIDPDQLCFNVEVEEPSLGDLNELANYKATLSDPEFEKAIRILIAIAVYYDYEIWQMDVKTMFLNGFLEEEIYMEQPEEMKRMQNIPYASTVGSITYAMRNTKDTFLVYGGDPKVELRVKCYCDAEFETDRDGTKSQTGYVFILNGGAVEFASSIDSNTLDLNFLSYNAKVLACSEQGIIVFKSPNPSVLQTKDKKLYNIHRVEIFDLNKWVWSLITYLVKLPFCVSLTNPQPITARGSIYMLLTNGDILSVDAYSATWEILTPPALTLYDADTRAMADRGTIIPYMFKGGETDHSS
nr:hypothetical protein [Tanacetum cinerariifolium]